MRYGGIISVEVWPSRVAAPSLTAESSVYTFPLSLSSAFSTPCSCVEMLTQLERLWEECARYKEKRERLKQTLVD